ncbi:two-partner secretion domain-containing protein [Limnofasciculus baicalensis]|uniref:S-layer family protein n=1 Tax=Limnofasciculus baicalensis BBK-W-15 TaxID=2699891 RepID=A0AAE3GN79_9CYAN|nr:filamentous hemagglutinin N-terminal domain-containing protein [Limnofasciculus baicalensis]MCP2726936.1 S-layer family protein [Limnofasciculus baicalensis BBK-W-15]
MKPFLVTFQLITSLALGWIASSLSVSAQIIPDTTLPVNSLVTPQGNTNLIEGGTQAGSNLFHSFQEFSVPTETTAFFKNAPEIQNIITRVTGSSVSSIDGLLKANGTANLFLLNPNGIIFGPHAQLNIGGSFLSTTATSLKWADGSEFSATNPGGLPLLTVNVPVGLQFGANPGTIINRSQATQVNNDGTQVTVGLQVQPGRTLALIGGNVSLEGGYLTSAGGTIDLSKVGATLIGSDGQPIQGQPTSGGRIEVGAVGANSRVQIKQQANNPSILVLNYEGVDNFQDIQMSKLAVIDASGDGGGDIQVDGKRVSLTEGSQIHSNTLGANPGGSLAVKATDSLEMLGNTLTNGPVEARLAAVGIFIPQKTNLSTTSYAAGAAGNVIIDTKRLLVSNGAEIVAFSFGKGRGGDILIRASDSVQVLGEATLIGYKPELFFPFGFDVPGFDASFWRGIAFVSSISSASVGDGLAGNLRIETRRLSLGEGGIVATNPFFGGDGGTLTVDAIDSVEVLGTSETGIVKSSIFSSSTGNGDAKDVTLNTKRLIVQDGANVQVIAFSNGQAGNIFINASESVEVGGTTSDGQFPSNLSASTFGAGNAGNVRVNTGRLVVSNGGELAVNSTKTGNAGDLEVVANTVRLSDRARMNATTNSGEGGNISINVRDYLLLRNGSQITAKAEGTGNGGNITIDPPFIIALENENSDIIANAFAGKGGNINITATGIYGLVPTRGPLNDSISEINASSETGIQGTVTINNPEVDPSSGLVKLPEELSDASNQVVVSCAAAKGNSFTIAGRGGLPEDPTGIIRGQTIWRDLQDFSLPIKGRNTTVENPQTVMSNMEGDNRLSEGDRIARQRHRTSSIIEATGWVTDEEGKVTLVAPVPNGSTSGNLTKPPNCL